jgi:predicted dehydrogenase
MNIGIAGIGFMGWIHWLAYQKVRGVQVSAICTRDKKKLAGDWRKIKGNFGPPGEHVDLTGVKTYADYSQLLADKSIDVVDLCLPPDMHAPAAIAAFKAGKHVFCEKPMALTIPDCKHMVAAAKKANRQLLIGHVLPFLPEYDFALKTIQGGKYGRVLGGTFKRVISDPLWLKDFFDPNKVGGPLVDLHVHDAHFIRLLFGMPKTVFSQGRMRGDVVEYCNTLFQFEDPLLAVHAQSGVINQQGRAFTHAYEVQLERATLLFDFAVIGGQAIVAMPLTLLDNKGKAIRPKLPAGDPMLAAFAAELKEVANCTRLNTPSRLLGGDLARDAIVLCQKQTDSVRSGKAVRV